MKTRLPRKALSLFLSLVMMLSLLPTMALAAEGETLTVAAGETETLYPDGYDPVEYSTIDNKGTIICSFYQIDDTLMLPLIRLTGKQPATLDDFGNVELQLEDCSRSGSDYDLAVIDNTLFGVIPVATVEDGGVTKPYFDFREALVAGNKPGAVVTMLEGVDLSEGWTPIENFKGTLVGGGYHIYNLFLDETGNNTAFIRVLDGGTLDNVDFDTVKVTSTGDNVAVVVGQIINGGTVDNCDVSDYNEPTVSGVNNVGGIVGSIASSGGYVQNCSVNANIAASGNYAGSIVGATEQPADGKKIEITGGCYFSSGCTVSAADYAGGIVGLNYAKVDNCGSEGDISVTTGTHEGGITGENHGKISNCRVNGQPYAPALENYARIGETNYNTLANAIAAVEDSETITMLGDVVDKFCVAINNGKTFTIDFADYSYTFGKDGESYIGFDIAAGVNVTFKNGTVSCEDDALTTVIRNAGTLTLDSTWVDGGPYIVGGNNSSCSACVITDVPGSTLNVTNGSMVNPGTNALAFSGAANTTTNIENSRIGGSFQVTGGTVNLKNGAVVDVQYTGKHVVVGENKADGASNGILNVEAGAKISNPGGVTINAYDDNTVNIMGGTVDGYIKTGEENHGTTGPVINVTSGTVSYDGPEGVIQLKTGNLNITDGTVSGTLKIDEGVKENVSISGGDFSELPKNEYLTEEAEIVVEGKTYEKAAEGDVPQEKGTTPASTNVAQIGETKYETLQAAINAAQSGDTITLLADFENIDRVSLPAGVTLDGNGHKITGASGIHIPAAGATIQNIEFESIHNTADASEEDCKYYGWATGKVGTQSAIYANGLTGTATITGCTFDNVDWDAIQITPEDGSSITITNNVFKHTNVETHQLRYIHIQHTTNAWAASVAVTIQGNRFYDTENTSAKAITTVGIWNVEVLNSNVDLTGNYFEYEGDILYTNAEVKRGLSTCCEELFPAIGNDGNALNPVQVVGNIAYLTNDVAYGVKFNNTYKYYTLKDLIAAEKTTAILLRDIHEDVTVPEGQSLNIQHGTYKLEGSIINNGTLNLYINTNGAPVSTATITNNGTVIMNCNAATGYTVNGGRVEITKGGTYDLEKIKAESIVISGGTFTTKPDDSMLKDFYIAVENSNGTYTVKKLTKEEAIAAGAIASEDSEYLKTLETNKAASTYLLKDVENGKAVWIDSSFSYGGLYSNGHSFTGSINMGTKNSVTLYGENFVLTDVTGKKLQVGSYNEAAIVTIRNATLPELVVQSLSKCTIEGGKFDQIQVYTRYANQDATEPQQVGKLTITGGLFKSNDITHTLQNHTPKSETKHLSDYVPEGYKVVTLAGGDEGYAEGYRYKVVPEAPAPTYVAQIGTQGYETLQAAINAAQTGNTIVLLQDVSDTHTAAPASAEGVITIPADKNIVIDLNGHTVDGGKLTNVAAILNKGTVEIKDTAETKGLVKRDDVKDDGRDHWYVIKNEGTMTLTGINVSNGGRGYTSGGGATLIENGDDTNATTAQLTVNGGNYFNDTYTVIKIEPNTTVTINGGTFDSTSGQMTVQTYGTVTVNGGSFTKCPTKSSDYAAGFFGTVTVAEAAFKFDTSWTTYIQTGSVAVYDATGEYKYQVSKTAPTEYDAKLIPDASGFERYYIGGAEAANMALSAQFSAATLYFNVSPTTTKELSGGTFKTWYAEGVDSSNHYTPASGYALVDTLDDSTGVHTYSLTVTPESANACVIHSDDSVTYYATLVTAGKAAQTGETVKALKDNKESKQSPTRIWDSNSKSGVTVDLAGKQVDYNLAPSKAQSITIIDSVGGAKATSYISSYVNGTEIVIKSGGFTGTLSASSGGVLRIEGGYFVNDPTAFVPEGYRVVTSDVDGYSYKVAAIEYVAQIGTTKYETLTAAIAAVHTDGTETTITMIDDEVIQGNAGVTVAKTQNIVLELAGHTIASNADESTTSAVVTNYGTLKIQDSTDTTRNGGGTGKITSAAINPDQNEIPGYANNTILNRGGTLTIESGIIESKVASGRACYAIDNSSNSYGSAYLTINGGKITRENATTMRQYACSPTDVNSVIINGGIIENTGSGTAFQTQLQDWSNTKAAKVYVEINGGVISAPAYYAWYDYPFNSNTYENTNLKFTGGTFDGDIFSYGANFSITGGTYNGEVTVKNKTGFITGGTFNDLSSYWLYVEGEKVFDFAESGNAYVKGKAYSGDWADKSYWEANGYVFTYYEGYDLYCAEGPGGLNEDYIAEGYEKQAPSVVVTDQEHYVDVVPKSVAKIGETKYTSLAAAVAAVDNNQTIEILCDITDAVGMTIKTGKTFTIDFGGHTYTVSKPGAGSTGTETAAFQLIKDQTVTFKNGTIQAAEDNLTEATVGKNIKRFFQSYANLTLENMTIDGTNIYGENSVIEFANGTVNITGSTSIKAKSGVETIKVDTWKGAYPAGAHVTINTTGAIGDVYLYTEESGNYTKSSLTIQNGKFSSVTGDNSEDYTVSISGGLFSSEPNAAYIAAGKVAVENTNAQTKETYPWTIGIAPVAPAVDENARTTSQSQTTVPSGAEDKLAERVVEEVLSEITGNTAVTGESASNIQSEAVENALKDKITGMVDSTSQLKITVKSVVASTEKTEISAISATTVTTTSAKYDVEPWVTIQDGDTTETRKITNEELAAANVTLSFRLAVPDSMKGDYVNVRHYDGTSGGKDLGLYAVQGEGSGRYVALASNRFSEFELSVSNEQAVVAENTNTDKVYTTLTAALAEAQSGQTVELLDGIVGGEYVNINDGVTLDLRGCSITNVGLIYNNGAIKDTVGNGYIQASAYTFCNSESEYFAVYDKTVSGYQFINTVKILSKFAADNTNKFKFHLQKPSNTADAQKLRDLLMGAAESGKLKVYIVVTTPQKTGENSQKFSFYSEYVQELAGAIDTRDLYAIFENLPANAKVHAQVASVIGDNNTISVVNGTKLPK